nr:hypothetical protein [Tanacetum cinerariifolium]
MASDGSDQDARYALSKLLQRGTVAEYESGDAQVDTWNHNRPQLVNTFEWRSGLVRCNLGEPNILATYGNDMGITNYGLRLKDKAIKKLKERTQMSTKHHKIWDPGIKNFFFRHHPEDKGKSLNLVVAANDVGNNGFLPMDHQCKGDLFATGGAAQVDTWNHNRPQPVNTFEWRSGPVHCNLREPNILAVYGNDMGITNYGLRLKYEAIKKLKERTQTSKKRLKIWDPEIKNFFFRHHLEDKVDVKEWGMICPRLG